MKTPAASIAATMLPDRPYVIARAPGRLDVMGGIADYSGSLVLELPLAEETRVALQRTAEPLLRVTSAGGSAGHRAESFELPLAALHPVHGAAPIEYAAARELFRRDARTSWSAYALGAFLVLMRERGTRFTEGARIVVESTIPEGKGVSSSAALEVAVLQAVAAAYEVPLTSMELALLAQKIEHAVVGAPCGLMDQLTVVFGERAKLLAISCQPATLEGFLDPPEGTTFFGIDSGVRHAVGGADYATVRTAAFMGYRLLVDLAAELGSDDRRWQGWLANVDRQEFEAELRPRLPERMSGAEFLARHPGTTDPATCVQAQVTYPVNAATSHPVHENARVRRFAEILRRPCDETALCELGDLMVAAHASYTACGLGSAATDAIVARVRELGPRRGLFGARITGGGSGGTVAVLARNDAESLVREIAADHARTLGIEPRIFSGSSDGAARSGVRWEKSAAGP